MGWGLKSANRGLAIEFPSSFFTKAVQQALHFYSKHTPKSSAFNFHGDGDDDDDEHQDAIAPSSASRKKLRRTDSTEERLRHMEVLHIQRRQIQTHHSHCHSQPVSDSDSDPSSSSEEDEEDGAVPTSEDAIYDEKEEPNFDLMKSMLRKGYTPSKNNKSKLELEENNIEIEVGTNKTKNKIDMINEGGTAELSKETKTSAYVADSVEVKGKEGLKFRDLGGMEVIVPPYHPHLPRWLGVRPMAGILLHVPPGCGKTKLAHAIANETGVPFYKISAT